MISLDRPDLRTCTRCHCPRPVSEFRLRQRGSTARFTQCRQCHNRYELERVRRKRKLAERSEFRKHLTRIARSEPSELNDLCAGIVTQFGGVAGVVELLAAAHDSAKPGSPARVRCSLAMLKVLQAAAEEERKRQAQFQEDISRMSDEDLERTLNERLNAMMESDPSLGVESAAGVEFQRIPPTNAEEQGDC